MQAHGKTLSLPQSKSLRDHGRRQQGKVALPERMISQAAERTVESQASGVRRQESRARCLNSQLSTFPSGRQRRLRLRAAASSSTRLTGVVGGALSTISGSSSASRAIRRIASMKASSPAFSSVSVGSIIRTPCTIRGKEIVGGPDVVRVQDRAARDLADPVPVFRDVRERPPEHAVGAEERPQAPDRVRAVVIESERPIVTFPSLPP